MSVFSHHKLASMPESESDFVAVWALITLCLRQRTPNESYQNWEILIQVPSKGGISNINSYMVSGIHVEHKLAAVL